MNTTVDVVCRYNRELIETSLEWNPPDIYQQFTKKVIQLEDQAVKDALKKLGYLSPEEAKELLIAADALRSPFENNDTIAAEEVVIRMLKDYFWGYK